MKENDGTVEVYVSDIREPLLRERCERFYTRLSRDERERADRFLHEDDRLRFITGRLMISRLSERKLGISLPEISLTEYGKPYIAGADGFCFNISHSGAYVVLALSDAPAGIDIEQHKPIEWREISQTFGVKEREILGKAEDPVACFYRIWTIREAFSKEEGIGLPLFEDEKPDIGYDSGIVRFRGKTLYFSAHTKDGYSVCVCGSYPSCIFPDSRLIQ